MRTSSIGVRSMLVLVTVSVLIVLVPGGLWLYSTEQHIEIDTAASDV